MKAGSRFNISLSSMIVFITLAISVLMVATVLIVTKYESNAVALKSAETLFAEISNKTIARIKVTVGSISTLTDMAALIFQGTPGPTEERSFEHQIRPMKTLLESRPELMSVYLGYSDGEFHMLISPRGSSAILEKYGAPAGTAYIDRTIKKTGPEGTREQEWHFLDEKLSILSSRKDGTAKYDPTSRPWYKKALGAGRSIYSEPYVFSSSRLPGVTCARELTDGGGVFGADVTLDQLGDMLAQQKVGRRGTLWILDSRARLVAFPGLVWKDVIGEDPSLPPALDAPDSLVRAVATAMDRGDGVSLGESFLVKDKGDVYLVSATSAAEGGGLDLTIVTAAPLTDIVGFIGRMAWRIILIASALLVLIIPATVVAARRASHSVRQLAAEAERIQNFDFEPSAPVKSAISEVRELAGASEVMKTTIKEKTESLIRTQEKLEKLVEFGIQLSSQRSTERILKNILEGARNLTHADAATLYIRTPDDHIEFAVRTMTDKLPFNQIPLYDPETGKPNHHNISTHVALSGETINIPDAYHNDQFDFSGTRRFDQATGYRSVSFLTAPLKTQGGGSGGENVIGVIQLINAMDPKTGDVIPFSDEVTRFVEALASQSAVTLENMKLLEAQKALFDSFIKLIATAIDTKSPYTGGHCERVPEIAKMLAHAATESDEEPFADFELNEDQAYEIHLASWLHDCGKVTTPEYVVDKATKLETIYNRIHEIRTRFEVLRRDEEIRYLKLLSEAKTDPDQAREAFDAEVRKLEDDFVFIADCNLGGEFMAPEKKDRMNKIAERTWQRYFNDRLGLSHFELMRMADSPVRGLPAEEKLLSDQPWHIIHRTSQDLVKELHDMGVTIDIPEHLYNQGELYNLGIERGTLTPEERFKINEHVIQTIRMLEQLPFPESSHHVPEYAGAHHETMIGSGYPRKLKQEQMSIQARILAIADIFEALTASDRPYKKAKTLNESIRIMSFMKKDGHIDPDLFELFLKNNVHLDYARKYLRPEQIDAVDLEKYLE